MSAEVVYEQNRNCRKEYNDYIGFGIGYSFIFNTVQGDEKCSLIKKAMFNLIGL